MRSETTLIRARWLEVVCRDDHAIGFGAGFVRERDEAAACVTPRGWALLRAARAFGTLTPMSGSVASVPTPSQCRARFASNLEFQIKYKML